VLVVEYVLFVMWDVVVVGCVVILCCLLCVYVSVDEGMLDWVGSWCVFVYGCYLIGWLGFGGWC